MLGVLYLSEGTFVVTDRRLGGPADTLPRDVGFDPANVRTMRHAIAQADPGASVALQDDHEVVERFRRLVQDGRLGLVEQPRRPSAVGGVEVAPEVPEATPLAELCPAHFVEFHFVDTRGRDVTGIEYVLEGPDRAQEEGSLRQESRIRRSDVVPGFYRVTIKRVDQVGWESTRSTWGESVRILGHISGYPDGTVAKVTVYPEFRETDGDEVWTGEATISGGAVDVRWTPDADGVEPDPFGLPMRFIVELSVDDGAYWAKSPAALALETPAIAGAGWGAARVDVGQELEIGIDTRAVPDGTPVEVTVMRVGSSGELHAVAELEDVTVVGGRAEVTWIPDQPDEYLFEVAIETGGVDLAATSEQVWAATPSAA